MSSANPLTRRCDRLGACVFAVMAWRLHDPKRTLLRIAGAVLPCALVGISAAGGASAASLADQQKLVGPTRGPLRELSAGALGTGVALSAHGTIALIGAPRDSGARGAAWIYEPTGAVWKPVQKLRAPAPRAPVGFGSSVALSATGNTAVVAGPDTVGAVWIFVRRGAAWKLQQRLVAPRTGSGAERGRARFGQALALSANGKTLLVGGAQDSRDAGAAWVFTSQRSGWAFQRKLAAPAHGADGRTGPAQFGASVALSRSGATAVIGGPGDDPIPESSGQGVGAAWVFTRASSSWSDQGKLTAPVNGPDEEINTEVSGGGFGSSVAVAGDGAAALIAGPADNEFTGAVWIYGESDGRWSEQQKLTAPNAAQDVADGNQPQFGASVVVTPAGASAVIGGPGDGGGAGAGWLYGAAGGSWTEQEKLEPPTTGPDRELNPGGASSASFGASVALSDDTRTAVIGGPFDDDPSLGAPYPDNGGPGAAWIFAG